VGRRHKQVPEYYFIVDWPTKSKPFYAMPYESKPEVCKSFDLMKGYLELASGAQRIHKYDLLTKRLEELRVLLEGFPIRYAPSRRLGTWCG